MSKNNHHLIWKNYITTNLDIISANEKIEKQVCFDKKNTAKKNNHYQKTLVNNKIDGGLHKKIKNAIKEKVYSVSQLETFADCGVKYLYKYILGIKEAEKTEDYNFSAVDLGNYFHKILYSFYKNIEKECEISDISSGSTELLHKLMELADVELKDYKDIPLFRYEIIRIKNTLKKWFEKEVEKMQNWSFSSSDFEFSFENISLNGLKIRGKIDRIEINIDRNEYIVADYKLSFRGLSNEREVMAGKSLQIPLYLLALNKVPKYSNYNPVDGVYYVINSDKKMVHSLVSKENIADLLEVALNSALDYKDKIENLNFSIIDYWNKCSKEICNFCGYNEFCRIMDIRIGLGNTN